MENKPTTAVLMPTYNRPDILEDTLNACLDLYRSYDFDVYVYDSSTDNKSGDIVATLQKRFDNLYYVRLSNFSHLDVKYLAMMQGKYLKKDYKYYYLCGDGNSLTSYSLEKIYPYMEQGVELITFIDEIRQKETLEYENVNDLFNSGFMNIGQWGGAIYVKRYFDLTDDEWNDAISKWFSDPKDEYIGTFGFLLTRMSLSKNFKAVVPAMDFNSSKILRRSCHKKDSFWRNDAINVLGVAYPNVLGKLPEVYTNKEKLFRNMLYKNFTQKDFFDYKMKNYFTLKDYFYYKKIFDACGVKILNKKIFLIAFLPVSLVKMLRFLFKLKKLKLLWLLR